MDPIKEASYSIPYVSKKKGKEKRKGMMRSVKRRGRKSEEEEERGEGMKRERSWE